MKEIPHGTTNGYCNYKCRCDLCRKARSDEDKKRREQRIGRPVPDGVTHGRSSTYENYGCRCGLCREAESRAKKEKRQRASSAPESISHGTRASYQTYGCRCDLCREANREYDRKRREENPAVRAKAMEGTRRYRERYPDRVKETNRKVHEKQKLANWERRKAAQKLRNDAHRLRSKGIEAETEADLLAAQNGVCAICGQTDKTKLSIDHCHTTGAIRGLLCRPCNLGLGCFKDDVERLKSAVQYLEKE